MSVVRDDPAELYPTARMPTAEEKLQSLDERLMVADHALRIAERFCSFRARCKPEDMVSMFHPAGTLVSINNVVFGLQSIWAALEDGQRFTHLVKWYEPWRICRNTLDEHLAAYPTPESLSPATRKPGVATDNSGVIPNTVTVERDGRIWTGVWFWDPRYVSVRETCVVEDGRIKVFATQRKF